jgi:U3 small nucleolar RNA-associated protein MPP10
MYRDFFDIPDGASLPNPQIQQPTLANLLSFNASNRTEKAKSPSPPLRASKVRFHEEVKVKLIKSKRNPLSLLRIDEDDDSDEEDDMSPFGGDWEDQDEEDEGLEGVQNDDDDEEEDEEEEGESTPDEDVEKTFDTIERTKEDLFTDSSPPPTDLSTYAQRQLALREQISQLEAENVADKDWTMMGEATSRSRPLNSLLEEDLEFEHRNRVAKVITEEKVAEVEDIIKKRIVEGRYDDVVRRRAFDAKPFLPSRTFELQDVKSQQSLAQIYEDEYAAARANGEGGVALDDRDGKLEKEHKELEAIWEAITDKLDALCNAHFTPKKVKPRGFFRVSTDMDH